MKKVIYTACAKSVFSKERGYQIYTCSDTVSDEERDRIETYIHSYSHKSGNELDSPVRSVYTRDEALGFIYFQARPSGVDYSTGRGGNFLAQAFFDCGNASIAPAEVLCNKSMFLERMEKREIAGEVVPTFLPEYPALGAKKPAWDKLEEFVSEPKRKERIANLLDAVIDCVSGGKQLVICDTSDHVLTWLRYVSMCLPQSVLKYVTFDTYAYDPRNCETKVVGVQATGTAYEPGMFDGSEHHVVFDFVNNHMDETAKSHYTKYVLSLTNMPVAMERLTALCEQELREVKGANIAEFLESMACIDQFLHYDGKKLFEGADADQAKKQELLISRGARFQRYHSENLAESVLKRMKELMALSGRPEFFFKVAPVFKGSKELYKQYKERVDNLCFDAMREVLQKRGFSHFIDYTFKLIAASNGQEKGEIVMEAVKQLSQDDPERNGFYKADWKFAEAYLSLLFTAKGAWLQSGLKRISEYYQKASSVSIFDNVLAKVLKLKENKDAYKQCKPYVEGLFLSMTSETLQKQGFETFTEQTFKYVKICDEQQEKAGFIEESLKILFRNDPKKIGFYDAKFSFIDGYMNLLVYVKGQSMLEGAEWLGEYFGSMLTREVFDGVLDKVGVELRKNYQLAFEKLYKSMIGKIAMRATGDESLLQCVLSKNRQLEEGEASRRSATDVDRTFTEYTIRKYIEGIEKKDTETQKKLTARIFDSFRKIAPEYAFRAITESKLKKEAMEKITEPFVREYYQKGKEDLCESFDKIALYGDNMVGLLFDYAKRNDPIAACVELYESVRGRGKCQPDEVQDILFGQGRANAAFARESIKSLTEYIDKEKRQDKELVAPFFGLVLLSYVSENCSLIIDVPEIVKFLERFEKYFEGNRIESSVQLVLLFSEKGYGLFGSGKEARRKKLEGEIERIMPAPEAEGLQELLLRMAEVNEITLTPKTVEILRERFGLDMRRFYVEDPVKEPKEKSEKKDKKAEENVVETPMEEVEDKKKDKKDKKRK